MNTAFIVSALWSLAIILAGKAFVRSAGLYEKRLREGLPQRIALGDLIGSASILAVITLAAFITAAAGWILTGGRP